MPTGRICDSIAGMDADLAALPDDVDALKAALTIERARMREVGAERDVRGAALAVARAKASEDLALIAHQKLRIAYSIAIYWLKRLRETGSVAPGQVGGHKPRKISGEHRDWLMARCRARAFTLHGLVAELAARGVARQSG
jgi:transposase